MPLVTLDLKETIATVTMDDGKVNALSPKMLAEVGAALDRAEEAGAASIVLAGRPGRFSAGFDLRVLSAGGSEAIGMLRGGFELALRLLESPRPVVIACTGHAIAMGSFLVCAGDYRIGAQGPFRVHANEVAIGLTLPPAAIEILRYRLTPPAFDQATVLARAFGPEEAIAAGFLDACAPPEQVLEAARQEAQKLATLDAKAHAATKLRARRRLLDELRSDGAHDLPVSGEAAGATASERR